MGREAHPVSLARRLLLIAALALVVAGCGGGDGDDEAATTAQSSGEVSCESVDAPTPGQRTRKKPATELDASKTWDVVVDTNCGSFTIRLDVKNAPATATSFVSLARTGYFDKTIFHRIVPGFVIQGGDPTASGTGGPGYKTVDKPLASARYTHGVVAMAKTQTEPAGTSGSQFFVVTADDAGLPPDYAILGEVVEGMDVVDHIGTLGDPTTEQPTETVEIEKATASSS
jgi:cyclophilin family peptidyl-prolyl cis-trans isomerase